MTMSQETDQPVYHLCETFRLLDNINCEANLEEGRYFLRHRHTQAGIETDEIGKMILENLPASVQKLDDLFSGGSVYVSPKLINHYLEVFQAAGVIGAGPIAPLNSHPQIPDPLPPVTNVKPCISVVIVTFNGTRFIVKNLESLARQTFLPLEIIVVDNASKDETVSIVKEKFKDVRVIANPRNLHYAGAVNIGVAAAASDLILILNQDIQLEQDCLEQLYRRYQSESNKEKLAAVVPQMRFNKLRTFINGIGNFISDKGWGSDNYFCVVDIGQFRDLKYVGSACFGAIMVTRNGWQAVGPLDPVYKSFYEDADWSIRAHMKGLILAAAPLSIVYHDFGGSYPSGLKLSFVLRNRMRFVLKNLDGILMRRFFKAYLKQDIKHMLGLLRRRAFKDLPYFVRAYYHLCLQVPRIFFGKSRIKKGYVCSADAYFTKCGPFVTLANQQLEPVINRHVIRGYYYFAKIEGFQFSDQPIMY